MNQDERLQILQMVEDGIITPAEAENLLNALDEPGAESAPPPKKKKRGPVVDDDDLMPDMSRFRRYWEYPFMVGLILLAVSGFCATSTPSPLLGFCGWAVFVVALLVAMIGWASQWSPWVHVRIHEHDGTRIAVSLPLPLRLIGLLTDIVMVFVRPFASRETVENIETAVSFVSMLEGESFDEPIVVEVLEDDGDHIEVYMG